MVWWSPDEDDTTELLLLRIAVPVPLPPQDAFACHSAYGRLPYRQRMSQAP